jgi:hypothetical protein
VAFSASSRIFELNGEAKAATTKHEDMAAIEARLAQIQVTGERLPAAILKLSYR